jgi:DNA-binding HxlR family transcriptional regulator
MSRKRFRFLRPMPDSIRHLILRQVLKDLVLRQVLKERDYPREDREKPDCHQANRLERTQLDFHPVG